MISRKSYLAMLALLMLSMTVNTGCFWISSLGPYLGFISIPIPVSPYFQDQEEDQYWEHERYDRVPILDPIPPGGPMIGLDEPSDDEVMRALERAQPLEGGLPMLFEVQRSDVRILKEKIADQVEEPRVYPLVGPAQLHTVRYKCTIYYTEVTRVGYPVPYTTTDEDAMEVIYIDHDHLHRVVPMDDSMAPVL
jgi:hypothetical protein